MDGPSLRRTRRILAGACLDWTERRLRLCGALAAAITCRLLDLGWIEHTPVRRAVRVTPYGREGLAATFGWTDSWACEPAPVAPARIPRPRSGVEDGPATSP